MRGRSPEYIYEAAPRALNGVRGRIYDEIERVRKGSNLSENEANRVYNAFTGLMKDYQAVLYSDILQGENQSTIRDIEAFLRGDQKNSQEQ